MSNLKKMKQEWKKLNESTKEQYASGTVGALSKDTHSADVKGVDQTRQEGSKAGRAETGDGDKKFAASKGAAGNDNKIKRAEGSAAGKAETGEGDKKFAASKGAAGPDNKIKRAEGSAAGKSEVGEYGDLQGFRNRIRSRLGLTDTMDKDLNKGNSGLNK